MRPRIRSIKPEMWHDERVCALSRDARLLLLGLVTMADDEGRFRARRSQIHGHVFPADDDALMMVDAWIEEIKNQGIVVFYVVDGTPYGAFRHWKKHQKINRPQSSELPAPPDQKIARENRVKRTNGSVSAHGEITESSVSPHSSARRRAFRSDPDPVVVDLCLLLAQRIEANDARAQTAPDSERWLNDMRLLLNDRSGDANEVRRIIEWCQADAFWRSNILSPAKLRKQFTQLKLKSEKVTVLSERRESPSDLLRAIWNEDVIDGDAIEEPA